MRKNVNGEMKWEKQLPSSFFFKNERSYNGENLVSEQMKEADSRKLFSYSMKIFVTIFATWN